MSRFELLRDKGILAVRPYYNNVRTHLSLGKDARARRVG